MFELWGTKHFHRNIDLNRTILWEHHNMVLFYVSMFRYFWPNIDLDMSDILLLMCVSYVVEKNWIENMTSHQGKRLLYLVFLLRMLFPEYVSNWCIQCTDTSTCLILLWDLSAVAFSSIWLDIISRAFRILLQGHTHYAIICATRQRLRHANYTWIWQARSITHMPLLSYRRHNAYDITEHDDVITHMPFLIFFLKNPDSSKNFRGKWQRPCWISYC